MRRVPAITELSLIDVERGYGGVNVSRCADDQESTTCVVGRSLIELGQPLDKKAHWSPLYFRHKKRDLHHDDAFRGPAPIASFG